MTEAGDSITLYSRWRGIAAAFATPLLLGLVAASGFAVGGVHPVPIVISVVAVLLVGVALYDWPVSCSIELDGIVRRCLLRQQILEWDNVVAVQRARGALLSRAPGGLTAVVRPRRRYLLLSHVESRAEFDQVRALIEQWAPGLSVSAAEPGDKVPPTWLYRRGGNAG